MTSSSSRYEVLGHLATGGMGEILLARRIGPAGFEKLVVLKRPLAAAPGSRRLAAALVAEARLLARINHPNVCQIHDLEEADGQYFLALELLEGLSLWTLLADAERAGAPAGAAIDPRVLCGLFAQICDGLTAIHELPAADGAPAGVVHRDISPGNLFVTEAGLVKLLDLGIAKHADSEDLTPYGNVKGKLPYVAPEQAAGKPLDARADLFALGLVLYDVARGRKPPSDRIGALACDQLELDALAPPLAHVILGAVQKDPAARFSSAAEMSSALARAGAALGGVADRAALAAWLRHHHADALEEQRARIRAALAGERPRALTLRSAIDDTQLDAPANRQETTGGGAARTGTERLSLDDDSPSPRTERLAIDDAPAHARTERLTIDDDGVRRAPPEALASIDQLNPRTEGQRAPRSPQRSERLASASAAPRPSRRVLAGIGLASVALAALVLLAVRSAARGINDDSTDSRDDTSASMLESSSAPAKQPSASEQPEASPPATPTSEVARVAPANHEASAQAVAATAAAAAGSALSADEPLRPQRRKPKPRPAPTAAPVAAAPGRLTIGSMPWADVRIGGKTLRTDIWRLELPAGRHVLHARTGDGREQRRSFQIEPDRETRIVLDWSAR